MTLLSWSYWFSLQVSELMPSVKTALLVAFAALFVCGIVMGSLAKKKSGSMFWAEGGKRLSSLGVWMGVCGLLLVFFTHELVYFFGARFWYLVWLAVFIAWLISIVRYILTVVPKRSAAFAERARIDKWLPKGK